MSKKLNLKNRRKKPKAPSKKVAEPEWGVCGECGAFSAWPGANVCCDSGEECDGVYVPSDENGKPL